MIRSLRRRVLRRRVRKYLATQPKDLYGGPWYRVVLSHGEAVVQWTLRDWRQSVKFERAMSKPLRRGRSTDQ